jgi:hypothetical protein
MPAESTNAAVHGADTFEAAHRKLLADETLQFRVEAFKPPDPPAWLEPLVKFLQFIAPYLQYVFWAGAALIVAIVLYNLWRHFRELYANRQASDTPEAAAPAPQFRPAPQRARALLEEADRLAREGKYGEAARVLLHRSIEDIETAHPSAIGLSMTSREIARVDVLSEQGRAVFSGIARAVETSLFGGRALEASQFAACRKDYESFALGGARA